MIRPDKAYSVREAAELLGLCTKSVQALITSDHFGDEAWGNPPITADPNARTTKAVDNYRVTGAGILAYRRRNRINA